MLRAHYKHFCVKLLVLMAVTVTLLVRTAIAYANGVTSASIPAFDMDSETFAIQQKNAGWFVEFSDKVTLFMVSNVPYYESIDERNVSGKFTLLYDNWYTEALVTQNNQIAAIYVLVGGKNDSAVGNSLASFPFANLSSLYQIEPEIVRNDDAEGAKHIYLIWKIDNAIVVARTYNLSNIDSWKMYDVLEYLVVNTYVSAAIAPASGSLSDERVNKSNYMDGSWQLLYEVDMGQIGYPDDLDPYRSIKLKYQQKASVRKGIQISDGMVIFSDGETQPFSYEELSNGCTRLGFSSSFEDSWFFDLIVVDNETFHYISDGYIGVYKRDGASIISARDKWEMVMNPAYTSPSEWRDLGEFQPDCSDVVYLDEYYGRYYQYKEDREGRSCVYVMEIEAGENGRDWIWAYIDQGFICIY